MPRRIEPPEVEPARIAGLTDSDREPERVAEHMPPSALVLHEALRLRGEDELDRAVPSLMWSGLAGGLSMGLCLIGAGLIQGHLPAAPWRVLLAGLGFTIGFVVVILGRQGLITESALTAVLPVLGRPRAAMVGRLARLWGSVLVGNLIGAAAIALVLARTEAFSPEARLAFVERGLTQAATPVGALFVGAVLAGWIIALAVWVAAASDRRPMLIILLLWLVGAGELAHVISGSVEVLAVVFRGDVGFGAYVGRWLVPVLVGNALGGAVLVAALNFAQVRREQQRMLRTLDDDERAGVDVTVHLRH